MPIDPRISLGVQPIQLNDPLTQYGQTQNILAAQAQQRSAGTQNELAQAQLGQVRTSLREAQEAQDYITQVMAEAKKNNAPTSDPMDAAMQMLNHPNAKVREAGKSLFDANQTVFAYQQDKAFTNRNAPKPPPAAAPSVAGPSAPIDEAMKMDYVKNGPPGVTYEDFVASRAEGLAAPVAASTPVVTASLQAPGVDPAPRVNNLPTAAPAAAAQTNALASPSRANELLTEINYLRTNFPYSAKAKEQITFLTERYKEAIKPQIVAPGSAIVVDGESIFTAKDKPLTQTDLVRNFEYAKTPVGGNYKGSFADFKAISAPKTTNVFGTQEKSFEGGLGKGQSERILANQVVAQDAASILETNQVGRELLKSGAITGTGADFFVGFNNALKQAGIDFGYADASANSQAYAAAMGANVGRIIKQFGAGTGLSDADRDYAAQMAGGKISITEAGLRKILDINDKAANRVIDLHNRNVSGIKTNIPLTVDKPTFTQPKSTVDQIPGSGPAPAVTVPQAAVDALKAGKGTDAEFDAIFGTGAAKRARGGK